MIRQLLIYFWQLCLCKQVPENCPYSPTLMGLSGMFLMLIFVVQWWIASFEQSHDLLYIAAMALSVVVSYIIYTYTVLVFRNMKNRLVQTVTCLFSTHLIIHLLAMPLILSAPYLSQNNLKSLFLLLLAIIYLFFTLVFSVWQFIITAHIYRYAIDGTSIQSVLTAFGLIAINILTLSFWR